MDLTLTHEPTAVPSWLNLDALDLDNEVVHRIGALADRGRDLVTQVLDFVLFAGLAIDESNTMARRAVADDDLDAPHEIISVVTRTQELYDLCQMLADAGIDVTGSRALTKEGAQRLRAKYGFADRSAAQ